MTGAIVEPAVRARRRRLHRGARGGEAQERAWRTTGVVAERSVPSILEVASLTVSVACAVVLLCLGITALTPSREAGFASPLTVTYAHVVARWTAFGNTDLPGSTPRDGIAAQAKRTSTSIPPLWLLLVRRASLRRSRAPFGPPSP